MVSKRIGSPCGAADPFCRIILGEFDCSLVDNRR